MGRRDARDLANASNSTSSITEIRPRRTHSIADNAKDLRQTTKFSEAAEHCPKAKTDRGWLRLETGLLSPIQRSGHLLWHGVDPDVCDLTSAVTTSTRGYVDVVEAGEAYFNSRKHRTAAGLRR